MCKLIEDLINLGCCQSRAAEYLRAGVRVACGCGSVTNFFSAEINYPSMMFVFFLLLCSSLKS